MALVLKTNIQYCIMGSNPIPAILLFVRTKVNKKILFIEMSIKNKIVKILLKIFYGYLGFMFLGR